jgi:hypothetical protein
VSAPRLGVNDDQAVETSGKRLADQELQLNDQSRANTRINNLITSVLSHDIKLAQSKTRLKCYQHLKAGLITKY